MPPSTTPSPAAIEMIQDRTLRVVWKPGPSIASAQTSPDSANQLNSRCNPIASTVINTSASPIERHRMVRIGGDRICESALTAASNMAVLPLVKKPSREVDTSKGFGKSLPALGETRPSSKTTPHEAAMTRVKELYPDNKVILREVGLRDGLQLVKSFPSTSAKQRWMRDEYAAGVRHFEVGSFLPPKTFPQFADVRDIIGTVASLPGAYLIALTLNERGDNDALAS